MNPTKGKGERYIYCPHDGGACLDIVVKYGWSAFNCERCPIYMQSESYGKMDSRFHGNDEDEHIERPAVITEGKEGEEMAKCLVKDCEKEGKHRGLCSAHIQRYRKGTLPGVEPLPSNRGKSPKKDRIELLKESAERVKAQGAKSKAQRKDVGARGIVPDVALVAESVSSGIVSPVLPFNVDKMEEGNREGIKVLARAFVAGLKSEFIAAMTEQACSIEQSAESKG